MTTSFPPDRQFLLPTLLCLGIQIPAQPILKLKEVPVAEVVAAVTAEERASLLEVMGFQMPGTAAPVGGIRTAAEPEKVPGTAGRTPAIPRPGNVVNRGG